MSNQGSLVSGRTLSANAETFSAAAGSVLAAGVDRQGKLTQSGDILLTTRGQLSAHGKNLASRHIRAKGRGIDFSASQTAAQSISSMHSAERCLPAMPSSMQRKPYRLTPPPISTTKVVR